MNPNCREYSRFSGFPARLAACPWRTGHSSGVSAPIPATQRVNVRSGHLQPTAGVVPMSALTLKADIDLRSTPPPDVVFFVAATSNPFHSLSLTTRRSSLLIRSERSASAALIATIVCRKVLIFDPSDTIPPSAAAIDPIAAT
jgi:hypothetical protein